MANLEIRRKWAKSCPKGKTWQKENSFLVSQGNGRFRQYIPRDMQDQEWPWYVIDLGPTMAYLTVQDYQEIN